MLLFPFVSVVAAEIKLAPEFNPICWPLDECVEVRQGFNKSVSKKELEEGWLKGEAPCDKEGWGKCLPAGITKTQIKFGGQSEFKDIGEFIFVNYNYLLGVAGILAAVMIIIAGAQWVTSGGNSEAIGSAKKRIGGALVGLLIAYLSYVILNTINPALVNLRLPQTFMIRQNKLIPEFCSQANPTSSVFALAAEPNQLVDSKKLETAEFNIKYKAEDFVCGKKFFIAGGGQATCSGDYCGKGQICLPFSFANNKVEQIYNCRQGQIVVNYRMNSLWEAVLKKFPVLPNLEGDHWLDADAVTVWGVCKNSKDGSLKIGKYEQWDNDNMGPKTWSSTDEQVEINKIEKKDKFWDYYIIYGGFDTAHSLSHWNCSGDFSLVGFIFKTEIGKNWDSQDANLFVGMTSAGGAIAGAWRYTVTEEHYIPLEKIQTTGVNLFVEINDKILEEVMKNEGWDPEEENDLKVRREIDSSMLLMP